MSHDEAQKRFAYGFGHETPTNHPFHIVTRTTPQVESWCTSGIAFDSGKLEDDYVFFEGESEDNHHAIGARKRW